MKIWSWNLVWKIWSWKIQSRSKFTVSEISGLENLELENLELESGAENLELENSEQV